MSLPPQQHSGDSVFARRLSAEPGPEVVEDVKIRSAGVGR